MTWNDVGHITFGGFRLIVDDFIHDQRPVLQMHPACDPQGLWCTPELRSATDQWLLERFGTEPVAFIYNKQAMLLSRRMMARLQADIENAVYGGNYS